MAAARLRHSVRFERRGESVDGYGNARTDWAPYIAAVWAEVRPMRGTEQILADKLQGIQPVEILIRYSSLTKTINTGDKAVNTRDGTEYNIRAIENRDLRSKFLTLTCETGTAVG